MMDLIFFLLFFFLMIAEYFKRAKTFAFADIWNKFRVFKIRFVFA